jgi:hypothetical protein
VPPLALTKTLIVDKATGIKEVEGGRLGREEEVVRIEVAKVEDEAILAIEEEETSHVRTMRTQRSRRTIRRTNYWLISVPFAVRRAIIKPTVAYIRSSKHKSFRSRKPKEKAKLKEM